MPEIITVCFADGKYRQYEKGTTLLEISREFAASFKTPIVAAAINNNIKDMSTKLEKNGTVNFFDLTSEVGAKIYQRSLVFIMVLAVRDLFPQGRVVVEHSLSKGLYCEFHLDYPLTPGDLAAVEQRMREIVAEDRPIIKKQVPLEEAVKLFEAIGEDAKTKLFKQLKLEKVTMYYCGDKYEYFYRTMVPSTGYLKVFGLIFHAPGMILRYPLAEAPDKLPEYSEMPKLGKVFLEAKRWAKIVECDYIAKLNEYIQQGEINNVILISEALHEKKIAEIADYIISNLNRLKIIMVAGPSSSGKTTFIQRLSIQLKVVGINTIKISIDDYFLDRERLAQMTKQPDLESLDVVDVELFNDHVNRLLRGEEVKLPSFDFPSGKQIITEKKVQINKRQLLIIEGIHGFNERMTASIPKHHKTKIYISPLTQIGIDQHSRIPSTDTRLIRRIVRDNQFRSHDALKTLKSWAFVRRGEEGNLFPLTEEADIIFNSALIYEMAVLRNFATPLLEKIGTEHPEYGEARRLIRMLSFFFPITDAEIPLNSILREFIGKSCFFA